MRKPAFLAAIAVLISAPAIADSHEEQSEAPEQSEAEAQAERAYHNAQQAHLAGLFASDGWYTMEGGLRWRYVDYRGTGESPTASDTVTVNYEGSFIDGEVFDSSFARGTPATFGLSGLIPAWEMAIPQMRVGETIELAAPAGLAYGPRGRGPIPGGATLLFRVELISIEE
ncbi:FKBP-type peptidyl-prolyl cis-trans isomerase [uncultured Erythrobacter sp.]|uniref:FKBP-type peptidyl-prolyl cis-trans isomerase n=1 Tax=uncultured Erythrobacter sp. TaxID=263913 RepID=UPI00263A0766|nr:FKBP-type peptidyl-prolyl cis-trans isomerase [uncultured Erythrobacter sp.]